MEATKRRDLKELDKEERADFKKMEGETATLKKSIRRNQRK
jgi:hypothetical protein